MRFEELTSAPALLAGIRDLGWTAPTPIQVKAIPPAREGMDVVGIAQTGTGKTAAFLLPALERQVDREGLYTLVVCPTRELAQQVAEDARALAKHSELWIGEVYGGVPIGPQIRDLRAGFDVVVATPGRLIDHLERGTIDLSTVEVLVLDEADRMLDMGFRPQIEAILAALPEERQTLMFSATMPNGVHALALRILNDPVWVEATPQSTAAEKVEQAVYPVRPDQKIPLLLELLGRDGMQQVLVFTRTKIGADLLHSRLQSAGINVTVLHGDRDMRQRQKALDAFADGKVRVLVATDVAQRGLDIEGISHVVNFDVPQNPEDYIHRIGRTGRAGAAGTAITFLTPGELPHLHAIERVLGESLPRESVPGLTAAFSGTGAAARPAARLNRAGGRLGSRRGEGLTPEQLKELLKVG
ncbi:MAG TPA: DEAD/DEAH box helicase [Longimicrobiales bacterium]